MTTLITPERTASSETDLLQSYCEREHPDCPECGYSLRSHRSARCPECGGTLRLGLCVTPVIRRRAGLLVLLLLWLLLAGTMNAVRAGQRIHSIARAQQWVQLGAPAVPGVIRTQADPGLGLDIDFETSGVGPAVPTPQVAGMPPTWTTRMGTVTIRSFGGTLPSAPAAWSRVGWSQWAGFAWWATLGLAAAVGLTLLVAYRNAPATARAHRAVLAIAWLGFAGYFVYHGYAFALELA